ncbi:hypothetical protein EYF80_006183 [Liparis tanakae]|uniref:Uncharacterized protein n=1 Tax=Liparis tanakae TaxID=230148 RepID=A0A4Z2J008_9TELE|nr:hypothetical protein EYF80_006183 [Liparis tanakae]
MKPCVVEASPPPSRLHPAVHLFWVSACATVLTLKSMPTVLTKAEVKEASAKRNRKDVFPTLLLPMISSLNM